MASSTTSASSQSQIQSSIHSSTSPATLRFQHNLVSLLSQTSPSFAALHATRIRKQQLLDNNNNASPEDNTPLSLSSPSFQCTRCGYLGVSIRVQRRRSQKGRGTLSSPNEAHMLAAAKEQAGDLVQRRCKRERYLRTTCPACTRVTIQPLGYPAPDTSNASPASPAGINVAGAAEVRREQTSLGGSSTENSIPQATRNDSVSLNIPSLSAKLPAPLPASNVLHSTQMPATKRTTPNTTSSQADPPKPSKRPKKKSGLAEMIARSKAQDENRKKQANAGGSGLASFLSGL